MRPVQFDEKLLAIIRKCKPAGSSVFIVGGAVRDAILGNEIHDFDFGVISSPEELAKCVADRSGGQYFLLDDKRRTCRVILPKGGYPFGTLDFTYLVDGNLEKDLRQRDFTINAMAVNVDEPRNIIDPLNGITDLRASHLKECAANSLAADPVRVLRAVRFHVQDGFSIEKNMAAKIEKAAVRLPDVSDERKRDELFRMTNKPGFALVLKQLAVWNIFCYYLSPVEDLIDFNENENSLLWDHTLDTVRWIECLLSFFFNLQESPPCKLGKHAIDALEKYRSLIKNHLEQKKPMERDRFGLMKLAALFHEIGKPACRSMDWDGKVHFYGYENESEGTIKRLSKELALSNMESRFIQTIVRNQSVVPITRVNGSKILREQVYDYYLRTGDRGIECCMIALACRLANGSTSQPDAVPQLLHAMDVLFDAWFHHPKDMISPEKILSGEDVIKILRIKPGPWVGYALKSVERAQACGVVDTRESAIEYLSKLHQQKGLNQGK